jgi:hypothetical protein
MLSSSARFRRIERRRLPGRYNVARPVYRVRRVDRNDLAGDEPIEQTTDRGSRCLTLGAASSRVAASIHVATCTGWTAAIDGTPTLATAEKFIGGAGIGAARVRVADVGGEEFEEAYAGVLAAGGNECRESGWNNWGELFHVFLKRRRSRRAASLRSMLMPQMPGLSVITSGAFSTAASSLTIGVTSSGTLFSLI